MKSWGPACQYQVDGKDTGCKTDWKNIWRSTVIPTLSISIVRQMLLHDFDIAPEVGGFGILRNSRSGDWMQDPISYLCEELYLITVHARGC